MPDRVESAREVKSSQNSAEGGFRRVEAVRYRLGKKDSLVRSRARRTKTRLRVGEEMIRFRKVGETIEN